MAKLEHGGSQLDTASALRYCKEGKQPNPYYRTHASGP
jgi:hypothetical protein